jgi:hypothetical protein
MCHCVTWLVSPEIQSDGEHSPHCTVLAITIPPSFMLDTSEL